MRRSRRNIRDERHGARIAHEDPYFYVPPYTCKCENCHFQSGITSVQRNEAQDKLYRALKKLDPVIERQRGLKFAFHKETQYLSSSTSVEQYNRKINRMVARLEANARRKEETENREEEQGFIEWIKAIIGL